MSRAVDSPHPPRGGGCAVNGSRPGDGVHGCDRGFHLDVTQRVRRRDEVDRRVVRVAFTEMGSLKAVKAKSVVDGCFAKAFCAIGDAELSRIEAGLDAIVHSLRGSGCADASLKE